MSKCMFCGGELTSVDTDNVCITCKSSGLEDIFNPPVELPVNNFYQPWICPRCGVVHAPHVSRCDCPPPTKTTTSYNIKVEPDEDKYGER